LQSLETCVFLLALLTDSLVISVDTDHLCLSRCDVV